jgi:hypothetical protein
MAGMVGALATLVPPSARARPLRRATQGVRSASPGTRQVRRGTRAADSALERSGIMSTSQALAAAFAVILASTVGAAEERHMNVAAATPPRGSVASPHRAFELVLSAGYIEPAGDIASGRPIHAVVGPGYVLGLDLGYRVTPRWGLLLGGSYHESKGEEALPRGSNARGAALGVKGVCHLLPFELVDPIVSLGAGYRALWESLPAAHDDVLLQGWEIATLQVALEYRGDPDVAFGPFAGVALNVFASRSNEASPASESVESARVHAFFSAGVAGRIDFGGTRTAPGGRSSARAPRGAAR